MNEDDEQYGTSQPDKTKAKVWTVMSVYCQQRERDRQRERKREGKESGGAIFVQALSWKLQPHYKWRHPENTWIVKQMACVRPSMKLRHGCVTVCTTHTGTHVCSQMTVVSYQWKSDFFFFRMQSVEEGDTQSQGLHDREWHPFSQWVTTALTVLH